MNKYPDDILVRLIVKKHPQESVYLSHRNSKTDFPVLTCAISLGKEEAYAVVGARPSRAVKVKLSDQWNVMIKDDEGRRKIKSQDSLILEVTCEEVRIIEDIYQKSL